MQKYLWMSSAAVVIGALNLLTFYILHIKLHVHVLTSNNLILNKNFSLLVYIFLISGLHCDPCLQRLSQSDKTEIISEAINLKY